MYEYTGKTRFRAAAIDSANALARHVRSGNATHSPWPFRVYAETNEAREEYTAHTIAPIKLFDELIRLRLGKVAAYRSARNTAWNWMMKYPMQNNVWSNYFEDVSIQSDRSNLNQLVALETARYLLEHPRYDRKWKAHVRGIIKWVENTFGAKEFGATKIAEQIVFYHHMGSDTSRYASINAMLYERTGDGAAKEKALRSFNWATYMERPNDRTIDGPSVGNMWWTDGYGDYIKHFMAGMAAVPKWAGKGNHLLESTSVVRSANYGRKAINYLTFDKAAKETLNVKRTPVKVTAGGKRLRRHHNLKSPGWTYRPKSGVLRVFHRSARRVVITLPPLGQGPKVPTRPT